MIGRERGLFIDGVMYSQSVKCSLSSHLIIYTYSRHRLTEQPRDKYIGD